MTNLINNSLLVAEQISKSYDKREVLKGINVSINQGTIVGFLGPNGSGKTTLFYIIAGLINPNSGRVLLDGEDITSYPMYKRSHLGLGYLPQDTSIFRGLSVEDNIDVILQLHCKDKIVRKQKLDEILDEFKIGHLRKNSSLSLSGGERRRVEIARTIASSPKFILLDEPFAGVDPIAVGDLKNIICILKTKGIGILITDHNVRETLEIVDKGYILYQGKILIEGKKEDIIDNKTVKEVYLGESFTN